MMKLLFGLLFMMWVSFKLNFWLIQMMMMMVFLMFIFNYPFTFLCSLSNLLDLDLIPYISVLLSFLLGVLMIMASEKIMLVKIMKSFLFFQF